MDGQKFDDLIREFCSTRLTRWSAIRGLVTGTAAAGHGSDHPLPMTPTPRPRRAGPTLRTRVARIRAGPTPRTRAARTRAGPTPRTRARAARRRAATRRRRRTPRRRGLAASRASRLRVTNPRRKIPRLRHRHSVVQGIRSFATRATKARPQARTMSRTAPPARPSATVTRGTVAITTRMTVCVCHSRGSPVLTAALFSRVTPSASRAMRPQASAQRLPVSARRIQNATRMTVRSAP